MATPEDTRAVFARIDEMLVLQQRHIEEISTSGRLNPTQFRHVTFAIEIATGLRALFQAETARQFGDG